MSNHSHRGQKYLELRIAYTNAQLDLVNAARVVAQSSEAMERAIAEVDRTGKELFDYDAH